MKEPSAVIISSSLSKNVLIIVDIIPSDPEPITTFSFLMLNILANLFRRLYPEESGYRFRLLYVFFMASIASGLAPCGFSFDDNFIYFLFSFSILASWIDLPGLYCSSFFMYDGTSGILDI